MSGRDDRKDKKSCRGCVKGYVFSLDALLAFILIILSVTATSIQTLTHAENDLIYSEEIDSIVDVLIKDGTMQAMQKNDIRKGFERLISKPYESRAETEYYTFDGSSFILDTKIETGPAVPRNVAVFSNKKFFLIYSGTTISRYGVINYWVWPNEE